MMRYRGSDPHQNGLGISVGQLGVPFHAKGEVVIGGGRKKNRFKELLSEVLFRQGLGVSDGNRFKS